MPRAGPPPLTLRGRAPKLMIRPMIRFEDIYETVKRHHTGADLELLRKAYIFSAVEHKGQTRASARYSISSAQSRKNESRGPN